MYVTYTDLIQIGIFIVALISLCYQIFKGKKQVAILPDDDFFIKHICKSGCFAHPYCYFYPIIFYKILQENLRSKKIIFHYNRSTAISSILPTYHDFRIK